MTTDNADLRLTNQSKYLHGASLRKPEYKPYSETWDHDHCEFCWAKFVPSEELNATRKNDPDAVSEGYTTTREHEHGAKYHWICETSFDDFVERFEWQVTNQSQPPP